MKKYLILLLVLGLAPWALADNFSTYGDTTVVTGPDGNPAYQLTADMAGTGYAGLEVQVTNPLTPATLTQLSAKYVMTTGTFGGGAPRFTLFDPSFGSAYIYFGTPMGGGTFSDPNFGNMNYADTGNYADAGSPDIRVYSNGFAGYGNGNTGQTWAEFLADPGVATTQLSYITLDLDGGSFGPTQVMDIASFDVNGTIYAPTGSVPDSGTTVVMLSAGLIGLAAFSFRNRRIA